MWFVCIHMGRVLIRRRKTGRYFLLCFTHNLSVKSSRKRRPFNKRPPPPTRSMRDVPHLWGRFVCVHIWQRKFDTSLKQHLSTLLSFALPPLLSSHSSLPLFSLSTGAPSGRGVVMCDCGWLSWHHLSGRREMYRVCVWRGREGVFDEEGLKESGL